MHRGRGEEERRSGDITQDPQDRSGGSPSPATARALLAGCLVGSVLGNVLAAARSPSVPDLALELLASSAVGLAAAGLLSYVAVRAIRTGRLHPRDPRLGVAGAAGGLGIVLSWVLPPVVGGGLITFLLMSGGLVALGMSRRPPSQGLAQGER